MIERIRRLFKVLPPHPYPTQFSPEMDISNDAKPSKFVLIASTPRSGSHFLGHMLMDHGDFGVPLEYLNSRNFPYWYKRFNQNDPLSVLENIAAKRTSQNGVFTLKAHWRQFERFESKIQEITQGNGFSFVVWIYRRSLLNQAISLAIAQQTQAWISGAPELSPAVYDYKIISNAARRISDGNNAWQRYLAVLDGVETICLCYDCLLYTSPSPRDQRGSRMPSSA